MQLIGMLDSPYVRRVAVALIVAKVPFEHRPISLFRHIDAFAKINPTLVADNGAVLMDSGVILDYLTAAYPRVAALTPSDLTGRLRALRATALGLSVMEKAVQRHYECALRPSEKRHDAWVERVMGQLLAGLSALDAEAPQSGWITGEVGVADITVACAFGFVRLALVDFVEASRHPSLPEFCARAEALPAFCAAPAEDGVTAPLAIAD
jgi:glutathione S-transferase